MTNFQFYLNSPLQGRSILGPADGFFLKPSSAFYLLFIGLQLHQVWVFQGLQVVVLPGESEHPGPGRLWRLCPLSGAYFSCANKSRGLEQ